MDDSDDENREQKEGIIDDENPELTLTKGKETSKIKKTKKEIALEKRALRAALKNQPSSQACCQPGGKNCVIF